MIILYSGAKFPNNPQTDPKSSLGGLISNTIIPNNSLNSLFDDIADRDYEEGRSTLRAFFIKNDTSETIYNLSFYIDHEDPELEGSFFKTKISCGFMTALNNESIEQVPNQDSEPYNVEFVEAYKEENKLLIVPVMTAGTCIGVFMKREVLKKSPFTCTQIKELNNELPKIEEFTFNLTWESVPPTP